MNTCAKVGLFAFLSAAPVLYAMNWVREVFESINDISYKEYGQAHRPLITYTVSSALSGKKILVTSDRDQESICIDLVCFNSIISLTKYIEKTKRKAIFEEIVLRHKKRLEKLGQEIKMKEEDQGIIDRIFSFLGNWLK
jgi:hypothetical protein